MANIRAGFLRWRIVRYRRFNHAACLFRYVTLWARPRGGPPGTPSCAHLRIMPLDVFVQHGLEHRLDPNPPLHPVRQERRNLLVLAHERIAARELKAVAALCLDALIRISFCSIWLDRFTPDAGVIMVRVRAVP